MATTARTSGSTCWTASYPIHCPLRRLRRRSGQFVFLPRRWPHRFWTVGRPARLLLIAVPGDIEGYFHEINTASTDDERHRIGKRYDIRMIPG
jgi:hypothetical protein